MKQKILIFILINFTFISSNSIAQTFYSETAIKDYWKTNGMDEIEGIYEGSRSYVDYESPCSNGYGQIVCYSTWRAHLPKYKLALIKWEGDYKLLFLSSNTPYEEKIGGCNCDGISYKSDASSSWKLGEIKGKLNKTATLGLYKCDWYNRDKTINNDSYIKFDNFSYFTYFDLEDKEIFIKLYPTVDNNNLTKINKSSGSGFAISSNGIIVTNYHVVDGAKKIQVRGIKSDFNMAYNAKILLTDKNNDLAIIQIDDIAFSSLGNVPFMIKNSLGDVGENIFVLGYPLRASMGDEIKLTNGIISSKTGFQGDITSYQISAPIQPGNSGGPLFNNQGYLIGIINAKHVGAENVTYGIKSIYLKGLIESLQNPPKLPTTNLLAGKTLAQQVEIVKKFVYIIEVE